MKHLALLIKPASSLCNLRCKYCFYHNLSELRDIPSYGIMEQRVAENIIEKALNYAKESITFMFQGGEPTLAGFDFFTYFICKVKELNTKKIKIYYSIQTNGVNIGEDFASFFKEHDFLVGLSLDGTKEINDFLRIDAGSNGTFSEIMKTVRLFDKYKVNYNILTVVTTHTARHIEKIFNFYKKCGFKYLQFIPCLDPLDSTPFGSSFSLTPEVYESFLKKLFSMWHEDLKKGKYTSIRFFDNLIRIVRGEPPEQCGMSGFCAGQFVIESDGTTFPCDFYCVDQWKTGNINEMSFEDIFKSENMQRFIQSSKEVNSRCAGCKVFPLCRGGCRRNRGNSADGLLGENIYCEAFYNFCIYAYPYLYEIAKRFR